MPCFPTPYFYTLVFNMAIIELLHCSTLILRFVIEDIVIRSKLFSIIKNFTPNCHSNSALTPKLTAYQSLRASKFIDSITKSQIITINKLDISASR